VSITYPDACADPHLFGPWFTGDSWGPWRVIDKAVFGLPLTEAELPLFRELTGRDEPPTEQASEAWFIIGRRGAKTVKAASLGVYLATIGAELFGYRDCLTRGERGVVQILAVDRAQARVCLHYIKAFFEQPMLARLVERETQDGIDLNNSLAIEVATNDKRRVRGRTVVAAIFDEVAHWKSETSDSPDEEVYRAVKPSGATVPNMLIVGISSPYARKGLLYRKHSEHYGKPGSVLVVKAPTQVMNPAVDPAVIADAYASDPLSAAAEYGAEFRTDVEAFISREAVEACVESGVRERPPVRRYLYNAFVDPSGGTADSMTLAISHREGKTAILDAVREVKPPFNPEAIVAEFAELMKRYRVATVRGDRYGAEWVASQFRKAGIHYEPSEKTKSDLYRDLLPAINSRGVDLLDNERLLLQLICLERRTGRGGKDIIDHPRGLHDDLANAVAGALVHAPEGWAFGAGSELMPEGGWTEVEPDSGLLEW
jgi:hypothetical protein